MALPVVPVYLDRKLNIQPFLLGEDHIETGKAWEDWLENLETQFRYFRITEAQDKKDALVIFGGKDISRLNKSLPPVVGEADLALDEYEQLRKRLDSYMTPRKNKHHARYLFGKLIPHEEETTIQYAARIRKSAAKCEFGDTYDDRILEHLIHTVPNQSLVRKCISNKWGLNDFLKHAGEVDDVKLQMNQMKSMNINKIGQRTERRRPDFGRKPEYKPKDKVSKLCTYCGYDSHVSGKNCPAYDKLCRNCGMRHHFASVCKNPTKANNHKSDKTGSSRKNFQRRRNPEAKKVKVDTVAYDDSTSSDDEYFSVRKIGSSISENTVEVQLDDVLVMIEPDSGAEVNIMDEHQFKAFIHRTKSSVSLEHSNITLKTIQSKLPIKGEFKTIIRNPTCGVQDKFIVVKGRIGSPPLLCKQTLEKLGMLKINPNGKFAQENNLRMSSESDLRNVELNKNNEHELSNPNKTDVIVNKMSEHSEHELSLKEILSESKAVFEGIGEIRDIKNNEEIQVKFSMRDDTAPVAQKPRPVAYHLQEPLRKWLDEAVEKGIYEWLPENEPVTWCSPLVVQPKPKFTNVERGMLEPNMIRASIDLRVPNKLMERHRITAGPIVEDFVHKFHDCKVFSKLDMRQGYHQLVLHPDSRAIATFSTPWGNMRPRRLVFGAKASQDLFDEVVYKIFGNIPGCLNQRDDILLGGKNLKEHNRTLEAVLKRAAEYGVTFNLDKCLFGVDSLPFYGYQFTKDGLKPSPDKVKNIRELERPQSKPEVRSFLGMVSYLSKFIPGYAKLSEPLRILTKKDLRFRWSDEQEQSFRRLIDDISGEKVMAFFDPRKPTLVRTEASFNEGIAAGLFQKTGADWKPVDFRSRALSPSEKNYSQTEKDALTILWAKNKFHMYLLGAPKFRIVTAHKSLLPMFNKPTAKLPPRITKWVMDMQDADYEVVYEPGKDEADPLDYNSRHPYPVVSKKSEDLEKVIKYMIEADYATVLDKIKIATKNDAVLSELMNIIRNGNWESCRKDPHLHSFFPIRNELYVAEGLVLRMNQIVIPDSLQRKIVKTAHKMGHLGMSKTKRMLRDRYWFPGMDSMVEEILKQCFECQVATKQHRCEPIKTTEIPKLPWDVVSSDFVGPYPDGHYNLVVIDKRSRYPVVEETRSTSFREIKSKLKKTFATFGTPRQFETDNGPPFNSHNFAEFSKQEGFKHHLVTPGHPKANGTSESFMKLMNKTEQIAHLNKSDRQIAIQDMLTAYRSCPHPGTNVSPYQALMNRPVRTKLETYIPVDELSSIDSNDKTYKAKIKGNAENRLTKCHNFVKGDYVLLKQIKRNKWSTAFEPAFYVIFHINGSTIAARRISDGREMRRDSSHFKLVNSVVQNLDDISLVEIDPDHGPDMELDPPPDPPSEELTFGVQPPPILPVQGDIPSIPEQRDIPIVVQPEIEEIGSLGVEGPRRSTRSRKQPDRYTSSS